MKMLITVIVFTTAIASPALAQTADQQASQRNAQVTQRLIASPPAQSFAQNPRVRARAENPAFDVYDTQDQYAGSDPDPRIRSELLRDNPNNMD